MEFVFCVIGITSAVVLSRLGNQAVLSLLDSKDTPLGSKDKK